MARRASRDPAAWKSVEDAPRGTYRVIYAVLDAGGVIVVAGVCKRDESTYQGL